MSALETMQLISIAALVTGFAAGYFMGPALSGSSRRDKPVENSKLFVGVVIAVIIGAGMGWLVSPGREAPVVSAPSSDGVVTLVYIAFAVLLVGVLYNVYENWTQRIMLKNLQNIDRETSSLLQQHDRRIYDLSVRLDGEYKTNVYTPLRSEMDGMAERFKRDLDRLNERVMRLEGRTP